MGMEINQNLNSNEDDIRNQIGETAVSEKRIFMIVSFFIVAN